MAAELQCEGGRQIFRGQLLLSDCLSPSPQVVFLDCLSMPQSPSQTVKVRFPFALRIAPCMHASLFVIVKEQGMTRLSIDMVSSDAGRGTLHFFAKAAPWSIGDSMDACEEVHRKRLSLKSSRKKKLVFVVDIVKLERVSAGGARWDEVLARRDSKHTIAVQLSTHVLLASVHRYSLSQEHTTVCWSDGHGMCMFMFVFQRWREGRYIALHLLDGFRPCAVQFRPDGEWRARLHCVLVCIHNLLPLDLSQLEVELREDEVAVAAGKAKFRSLFPKIDDRSKSVCLELTALNNHRDVRCRLELLGSIRSYPDAKPSTPQTGQDVSKAPMHFTVGLDSLAVRLDSRQLGGESSVTLRQGAMFFNSFFQKPFMSAEACSLTRRFQSRLSGDDSIGRSDDAASVQDIGFKADSAVFGLSPFMNLGNTLVILGDQIAAFSSARSKRPEAQASPVQSYSADSLSSAVASPSTATIPGAIYADDLAGGALNASMSDDVLDAEPRMEAEFQRDTKAPQPSFFVFDMQLRTVKVLFDAVYLAAYHKDFAVVEFEEFLLKLDSTKPVGQVRECIRSLDPYFRPPDDKLKHADVEAKQREDMLAGLQHVDINGGVLTLGSDSVRVKLLHGGEEPLVELKGWGCFGPMYSCNIDYPLKPYMHSVVWIADNIYQHNISDHGSRFEPSITHFMTVTSKPEAPNKIYTDMILAGKSIRLSYRQIDGPKIAAANETLAQCTPKFATAPRPTALSVTELPPSRSALGPPLTAADLMRSACHGKFSLSFDRIAIVIVNSESNSLEQVKEVRFRLDRPRVFAASSNLVELSSGLVSLEVEIKSMSLSHGAGNYNRPSLVKARRTTVSSKGASKASKVHRVLSLPALVISFGIAKDRVMKDFIPDYRHHDVFIRPAHADDVDLSLARPWFNYLTQKYILPSSQRFIRDDPFYWFRSRPMTSKMNIEIRLADTGADEPIVLDLCLYYLLRIISFFASPASKDGAARLETAAANPPAHGEQTSEIEAAHTIDLQIKIDKLVVYSWLSETNMKGVVGTLANLELQMRFLRKVPASTDIVTMGGNVLDLNDPAEDAETPHLFPLVIDHLFVDIRQPKLFIRDWNVHKRHAALSAASSAAHPRALRPAPDASPRRVQDIMSMIRPSEIFSDVGTIEVSLTESGSVSTRNHTFQQSGKLLKILEQPLRSASHPPPAPAWAFFVESESALTQCPDFILRRLGNENGDDDDEGAGASGSAAAATGGEHIFAIGRQWGKLSALLSSAQNDHRHHSHRQQSSLASKDSKRAPQRWMRRSHSQKQTRALSAIRDMQSRVRQFSHRIESQESMRMAMSVGSESDGSEHTDALFEEKTDPFGNKMWGLRVIDSRILFTIKMRDILFGYIARCFELFGSKAAKEDERTATATATEKKAKASAIAGSKRHNKAASVAEKVTATSQLNSELLPLLQQVRPVSPAQTGMSPLSFQSGPSAGFSTPSPVNVNVKDCPAFGKMSGDDPSPPQQHSGQQSDRDVGSSSADIHFFKVEFINPQVNFLDVNTQSSVIITAGRAGLDGHRSSTAAVAVAVSPMKSFDAQFNASSPLSKAAQGKSPDASLNRPMKRQEIQLNMEGVSAFTVLTFSSLSTDDLAAAEEDEADTIHWKPAGGKEEADLPFLKTAITDFQIQAKYMFWTEVPEEEVAAIVVRQSEKELVAFFQLNLPYLRVDIESWQVIGGASMVC